MYQSSCVFASSIGYVGGPGSGTAMLVVGLLVLAEWRAPNGSVMALKLQHDRFQSAGAGSMRPRLYSGPLRLCSLLKKVKGQGDYSAHKSSIISR